MNIKGSCLPYRCKQRCNLRVKDWYLFVLSLKGLLKSVVVWKLWKISLSKGVLLGGRWLLLTFLHCGRSDRGAHRIWDFRGNINQLLLNWGYVTKNIRGNYLQTWLYYVFVLLRSARLGTAVRFGVLLTCSWKITRSSSSSQPPAN